MHQGPESSARHGEDAHSAWPFVAVIRAGSGGGPALPGQGRKHAAQEWVGAAGLVATRPIELAAQHLQVEVEVVATQPVVARLWLTEGGSGGEDE